MTSKLVGVLLYSNLLPGRVIDASTSITLRHPRGTRRLEEKTADDRAVWSARPAEDEQSGVYARGALKQLPAGDAIALRSSSIPTSDAAAQYEFYARLLAAPYYPSISLYA